MRGNRPGRWVSGWRKRSIPACAGEPRPTWPSRSGGAVYPRVCGGTGDFGVALRRRHGLSPRVRGNPVGVVSANRGDWSIPACAGEPCGGVRRQSRREVYPRVCGGTRAQQDDPDLAAGLSPRVRGNLYRRPVAGACRGSIPACAGEPGDVHAGQRVGGVYPRVCGGTPAPARYLYTMEGLSPRVRGNPAPAGSRRPGPGSIPACAGEPAIWMSVTVVWRVYPRVCGGTAKKCIPPPMSAGLSPRVRGNRLAEDAAGKLRRSIPACAGEPVQAAGGRGVPGVYPRVCGGTCRRSPSCPATAGLSPRVRGNLRRAGRNGRRGWGLSPRVRGNRSVLRRAAVSARSIPACAGEPRGDSPGSGARRVYPRVCGGTLERHAGNMRRGGLSPRVRGNPAGATRPPADGGSIPACAGEPRPRCPAPRPCRVYPRVCGGTRGSSVIGGSAGGLSPRVRGNRGRGSQHESRRRSIPACAGEPRRAIPASRAGRVYPRVCGGTLAVAVSISVALGLSPRVRGNPADHHPHDALSGSIPACAGEPLPSFRPHSAVPVYPRVCGGTAPSALACAVPAGLSPRVRGNPRRDSRSASGRRSIPACAGEPGCGTQHTAPDEVYPRVCGGTDGQDGADGQSWGLSPRVRGNHFLSRDKLNC